MRKILMSVAAVCTMVVAPSIAQAAVQGFATANVNMRSGPSTGYPAVTVIPVGSPVTIHGCMSSVNWCDVSFVQGRGWVSGSYVQANYRSNRVYIEPGYYGGLGIPSVTFDVDRYWGTYYRNRDFYRDRDRWRRYDWDRADRRPPPPRRWDDDRRGPPPGWDRDRDRDRFDRDRDRDRFDRDRDRDRDRFDRDRDRDRFDRDRDRDRRDRDDRRRDDDRRDPPPGADRDRDQDRARERDRDRDRDRDRAREERRDRPERSEQQRPERRDQPLRNSNRSPDDDGFRRCPPGQCGN